MKKIFRELSTILVILSLLLFVLYVPFSSAREAENITNLSVKSIGAMVPNFSVPTSGKAGFEPGAEFYLKDPAHGKSAKWVNIGTKTSCTFVPVGPVFGYGFVSAGARVATSGDTTEEIAGDFANTDIAISGHTLTDDTDHILSTIVTDDNSKILITVDTDPSTAHGYMWGALRSYCVPTWDVVYAGTAASTAATSTAITVTGVLATDIALANYTVTDDTDYVVGAACTANTITVKHSTTSSTGHTIAYMVLRPRGTFKPAYYVYAAGKDVATTADATGIATNGVTVAGSLTTDIPFAIMSVQGGTIEIARAQVATAGTLTVQFSADPSTTSAFSYFILRAY